MIDFTKYTLQELRAIIEVLDSLTDDMPAMDDGLDVAMCYYTIARRREGKLVKREQGGK